MKPYPPGRRWRSDLFPVDVDVSDLPAPELAAELVGRSALGEELDRLGIEHGVVEDRVIDVEDGRLADQEDLRLGGQLAVDRGQRGIEPAWEIVGGGTSGSASIR